MGTNYYIRYNICSCCNRYDEMHIGKSSAGWQFSFHAVEDRDILLSSFDPKEVLLEDNFTYVNISSFQEWKSFIERYVVKYKSAKIYNEYDELQDVEEFFDLVEHKRGETRNHAEYMKTEYKYQSQVGQNYIDSEGYSFSKGEFS